MLEGSCTGLNKPRDPPTFWPKRAEDKAGPLSTSLFDCARLKGQKLGFSVPNLRQGEHNREDDWSCHNATNASPNGFMARAQSGDTRPRTMAKASAHEARISDQADSSIEA
jgi:hypothetical protein